MVGINEYTYHDEHQVIYRIVESLHCTPETNITLYVNYTGIFLLEKKKNSHSKIQSKTTATSYFQEFQGTKV